MSRNRETCLTHGTGPGQRNYNFKEPPCKKNDSGPGCSASRMWCEATSNLSHVQTQVLTNVEQKIHLSPHRCSLSSFFFLFFCRNRNNLLHTTGERWDIFNSICTRRSAGRHARTSALMFLTISPAPSSGPCFEVSPAAGSAASVPAVNSQMWAR